MRSQETIAAIATAAGEGGIGIVRVSGPEAGPIASRIFRDAKGRASALIPRHAHFGHIVEPSTDELLDEVLVLWMPAPASYTREDVFEVQCHGGMVPLMRVLELVVREGARPAEPGEFTRRAFLSGRIDLVQAEAALDLIRSRTEAAERMALMQLEGALSQKVNALREGLLSLAAQIEAHMDFPDDEIGPQTREWMIARLAGTSALADALCRSYLEGRLYREGLKLAIVGKPNTGKSSLLNALLERDRAIVAEMPGTTRDVIEEGLGIRGLYVRVMDTAGIRDSHDMVEAEGVRRSLKAIEEADIVMAVFDSSQPLAGQDRFVIERITGHKAIAVLNKSDINPAPVDNLDMPSVRISAKTGEGLDALKDAVYNMALGGGGGEVEGVVVTNIRHRDALRRAGEAMGRASALISSGERALELPALEVREAMDALGEITGAVTTDEILNRIFAEFCIGK